MNPLSAIFGAGVAVRNALYDRRVFQVEKLARPVVSIGNISVGGSGKTPFVIALGQLLAERGIPSMFSRAVTVARLPKSQSSILTARQPNLAMNLF